MNACFLATPARGAYHRLKTLVGAVMWPADRLRELNGLVIADNNEEEIAETTKFRPWEIDCVVHGFPDWEDAEEFAANWKRLYSHPVTKELGRKLLNEHGISSANTVTRRLRELFAMLHCPPYSDWTLTTSFTSYTSYAKASVLTGFNTCRTNKRSLDWFPLKANADSSTLATLNNTWRRCVHLTRDQKLALGLCAREHPEEMQRQLGEWTEDQFGVNLVQPEPSASNTLKRRQLEPVTDEELAAKRRRMTQLHLPHAGGTEPVEWTRSKSQPQPAVEPAVDDEQAMQRLILLAIEMRCDPSITTELNRMLEERCDSDSDYTLDSLGDVA